MTKHWFVFLLLLIVFSMNSCDLFIKREWTILVYMDADNNLEEYGILNFNQMEAADFKAAGVDVIVLFDRIPGYDATNGDWNDTRLYRIKYDKNGVDGSIISERLSSAELGITASGIKELNMGDPLTVSNFIDYCKTNFEAPNYSFIFWNHGSGWRDIVDAVANKPQLSSSTIVDPDSKWVKPQNIGWTGSRMVCQDETNDYDILYTQEIRTGIAGKGLDVIGFDLCLGAMLEVMYEIKDDASYMIAAEDTTPAAGWDYELILNEFIKTNMTPLDFVNCTVNAFETLYSTLDYMNISGVDLTKINSVMTAFDAFSNTLYDTAVTDTIRDTILTTFYLNTEDYYAVPGDLNLDLWDAADQIQTNYDYADAEAAALKTALDNAVVAEWHSIIGNPRSHGIAVHYCYIDESFNISVDWAYWKNSGLEYPLAFVDDSAWVPVYPDGPGLLHRLWFETLP